MSVMDKVREELGQDEVIGALEHEITSLRSQLAEERRKREEAERKRDEWRERAGRAGRVLEYRLAQVEKERDEALSRFTESEWFRRNETAVFLDGKVEGASERARARAAEARCTRLEEALEGVMEACDSECSACGAHWVARAALQDSEKGAARDEGKE